ncbi:adhesion G protein-coupled receptor E5-like [Gastrophryne carolinensis]
MPYSRPAKKHGLPTTGTHKHCVSKNCVIKDCTDETLASEADIAYSTNPNFTCEKNINGSLCSDKRKVCPNSCDDDSTCPCADGYATTYKLLFGENTTQCEDIQECITKTEMCGAFSQCVNTVGGYYCACHKGYYRKGNVTNFCPSDNRIDNSCIDIDECNQTPRICGPNSVCKNVAGSYECSCLSNYRNISNICTVTIRGEANLEDYPQETDIGQIDGRRCEDDMRQALNTEHYSIPSYVCPTYKDSTGLLENGVPDHSDHQRMQSCSVCCLQARHHYDYPGIPSVDMSMPQSVMEYGQPLSEHIGEKLSHIFRETSKFNKTERLQKSGILLNKVERIMQNLAFVLQGKPFRNERISINIKAINRSLSDREILLESNKSTVKLNTNMALGDSDTAVVGSLEYSNVTDLLHEASLIDNLKIKVKLASPLVSVFLDISDTSNLSHPVELHIKFTEEVKEKDKTHCAFWSSNLSSWSTIGCEMKQRNANGVVCACTHLTSFAVLLALEDIQSWTLDLITRIGLSISIICLVLAIFTFCCCRSLRGSGSTRKTIHTHLCICLLLANFIFLLGIEATGNEELCGIVAGLLHVLYLAAFCWMSLEALELYLMLVTVFNTQLKTRYLVAVGYGVPAVIVIISAAVYHEGYGTKKHCWLSLERGFNWSFMGPVCIIILVNCGIFVLTVWKLTEKMATISPEQGKFKKLRTLTVTSIAQLCILGCCWAFGFLMFSTLQMFFAYAFTICNALQGAQIFFLHCLMNKKVRAEYRNWLCAIAHFKAPVYSEFNNSSNINTQSRAAYNGSNTLPIENKYLELGYGCTIGFSTKSVELSKPRSLAYDLWSLPSLCQGFFYKDFICT